ncbi:MAG: DoxX family protein [Hydrogenophilaceae bacterium]|nr:DoxX family protein [Hydrogenophilaceae bacterium]
MTCTHCIRRGLEMLNGIGSWLPNLAIRMLLAYEFWTAGLQKLKGGNWFTDIHDKFPFPFNVVPAEISWQLATWTELIGPILLVLGLGTRFASAALVILTLVAWASVHAGNGYNVCDNGYQLPLMYLVLFLPLLFQGPGKLSLDHWIRKFTAMK